MAVTSTGFKPMDAYNDESTIDKEKGPDIFV